MALIDKLTAIADAIRDKTGKTEEMTLDQMPVEIEGIQTGVPINNQNKTITENGTYTADEGYTGLGTVNVNVASSGGGDDSFKAFIERTATEVTLPSDLTKIGDYAFYQYTNLVLRSLPAGVTSIGYYAFHECRSIALTSLPAGLTSIDQYAFSNCDAIALTALPEGLTSIEDHVFKYCGNLALTSLPSTLKKIGMYAFYNCTKLALTSIPSGLTNISSYAFCGCTSLTEITFEGKPYSVTGNAFNSCKNLLTINVPWAEGEVANAPWGATNATINYNYTGG